MPKYAITYKEKEYTLCLAAVARLTGKSATFLTVRLSEGMTMQEAIEAVPGDPARRKKYQRVESRDCSEEAARRVKQEAFSENNKTLINQFIYGGARHV